MPPQSNSNVNWDDVRNRTLDMLDALGIVPLEVDVSSELEEIVSLALDRAIHRRISKVILRISSNGGKLDAGFGIYNNILLARAAGVSIIGLGMSKVRSAALTILQACDERYLCVGSTVLVHWGSYTLGNSELHGIMNEEDWVLQSIRDSCSRTVQILSERSGQSPDEISKMCWRDEYMSATKAVRLGLADKVVTPADLGIQAVIALDVKKKK